MSSFSTKLSKSVIYQLLSLVVNGVLGILIVPFIVNKFGIEKYGIYQLIFSLVIIDIILELGVGSAVFKYASSYKLKGGNELNVFFWTLSYFKTVISIISFLVVFIFSFYFQYIFKEIPQEYYLQTQISIIIFGAGLIIKNISTVRGLTLKGLLRFDYAIISDLVAKVIYFAFVLLMILYFYEFNIVHLSFLTFIFTPFLTGILYTRFLKKTEPTIKSYPARPDFKIIKETYRYMGGMSIISLIAQIFGNGSRAILGMLSNPVSVGTFGIATKIRAPLESISDSILRPLIPAFGLISEKNEEVISKRIIRLSKFESLIVVGISAIFILYANEIANIWLGGKIPQVGYILQIWLIQFILPRPGVMLMVYYSQGKTRISLIINIINTALSFVLVITLTYYFDLIGFIWGLVIPILITTILYFIYFLNYFKIKIKDYLINVYLTSLMSLFLMIMFSLFVKLYYPINSWFNLILVLGASILIYFLSAIIFIGKNERERIIRMTSLYFK